MWVSLLPVWLFSFVNFVVISSPFYLFGLFCLCLMLVWCGLMGGGSLSFVIVLI